MEVMAARKQTKRRTLRLADGGVFHIGPGTVSVLVDTLPLDPPALVLHINRSCGAFELVPDPDGVALPPERVDAARVLEIVNQINADRMTAALRGEKAEPPVQLPPTLKSTARHVSVWNQKTFSFKLPGAVGYPSKAKPDETLWVQLSTGAAVLERPNGEKLRDWEQLKKGEALAWLMANDYVGIPAALAVIGGTDDAPKKRKR